MRTSTRRSRRASLITVMESGRFSFPFPGRCYAVIDVTCGAYYSFLWKVESFPPGDNFRVGPIVRAFRWTAKNDYIILSDSGFLSVGGGYVRLLSPYMSALLTTPRARLPFHRDGKFGLWLDSSFDKGFTTSCPAFANEPLCSPSLIKAGVDGNPEGKFEIMAVECWAVG